MEWKMFRCCIVLVAILFVRAIHVFGSKVQECPRPESIYPCYCDSYDGDISVHCNHLTKEEELRNGLSGLKGLKVWTLSFFGNKLGTIDASLFEGLKVERLEMENTTATLESPQLRGLENTLSSISIRACYDDNNPIIGWSLEHLTHLRDITAHHNVIPTLRNNWSTSSPASLNTLGFENNAIEKMEDKVFSHIKGLMFLYLDGNLLTTLSRSMLPSPASNLRAIELRDNMISNLPYDMFEDMSSLRRVDLAGNRLTTLEETVWKLVVKQMKRFSVEENPIVCDKKIKWILPHRDVIDGTCGSPEQLKNKSFWVLVDDDLR